MQKESPVWMPEPSDEISTRYMGFDIHMYNLRGNRDGYINFAIFKSYPTNSICQGRLPCPPAEAQRIVEQIAEALAG